MKSLYVEKDAARFADGAGVSETLALRTYTSRLLGADPALVLHGGGNTSAKGREPDAFGEPVEVLYVKGSGWDLASIEPPGLPAVRLEPLRRLRALASLSDEQMVNELRSNLVDASAPNPSIETLLHAFLPARFIDHTHADAILAVADQPSGGLSGEKICREIFGRALVWVPYVMPGFALAKHCIEAYEAALARGDSPGVIVLERHGIFTFGETAKESYEAMIAAVTQAERYIGDQRRTASLVEARRFPAAPVVVTPRLRGVIARLAGEPMERGPFVSVRASDSILAFLDRPDVADLVLRGCATPDHVIRTKPTALFIANPELGNLEKLTNRFERETVQYARDYDGYFAKMCEERHITRTKLDPWPRVVLLPGFGLCALGKTLKEADAVADIYEHTIEVMVNATEIGAYVPVGPSDLFDLEYWSLEQAKIKKTAEPALFGKVAFVTGAASGIGRATAARFLELGAHVALVDHNAKELVATHEILGKKRATQVLPIVCDVTSTKKVNAAVASAVSFFGGIDVVVSNAGNAPEGRLDTEEGGDALRASLELNLLAHNHVARAATEVMLAQGRGGCLLFNVSKAVFNPGPGFGPYAVAKSALLALMRQYAIDLGKSGIRANAVNADRIRTPLFGGGVLESRAAARGLSVDDYFRANLLGREVLAEDVADAFAYLAQARATTGCVVTVDGGNSAAFPR